MKMFDPLRPTVQGRPQLVYMGRPIGVAPSINFYPFQGINYYAEVHVIIAPNTGRWLAIRPDWIQRWSNVDALLIGYLENPEAVLASEFGWSFNKDARERTLATTLSIDDLGDLDDL